MTEIKGIESFHDSVGKLCSGIEALSARLDNAFDNGVQVGDQGTMYGVGEGGTSKGARLDADFEEGKHPRAADGKFGSGGGSSKSAGQGVPTVQEGSKQGGHAIPQERGHKKEGKSPERNAFQPLDKPKSSRTTQEERDLDDFKL